MPAGPFDPLVFAAAAERLDAPLRFTALVPAQLGVLLHPDAAAALPALRRFDRILVGGQSTPAPLLARAAELGLRLTRTYGSSETAGGCVYDGAPIGGTAVRIVDGQIELSGGVLADGYLADRPSAASPRSEAPDASTSAPAASPWDDERTAAAFPAERGQRWYRTGDAGTLADGILTVTGRLDDVIISGGLKVSLAAIEAIVRAIPGHADAVVVPAPSDRWGEVPVVVTTTELPLAGLRSRLAAALGPAAAPDRVIVLNEIPQLGSGKPDRRALRALAG